LPKVAPENTLASFALAMQSGADGVEFDVHLSRDQIPVVVHDDTLERTTGVNGFVKDLTANELSKLNAGFYKRLAEVEPIPTLADVLAQLPDRAVVNIELKSYGNFDPKTLVRRVDEALAKQRDRLRIILSSFDGKILRAVRELKLPDRVGVIAATDEEHWPGILWDLAFIQPDSLHLPQGMATKAFVKLAHALGYRVLVWTVNDVGHGNRLLAHGVDGIFSDDVRIFSEQR
jgi:glycerophosphoryl diester phosphodiesterase